MTEVVQETVNDTAWTYVRAALADNPDADIYELAQIAAEAVKPEDLVRVLRTALVPLVREVVSQSTRGSMDVVGGKKSPKLKDRASWWSKMLGERVSVGGVWKTLGECTFDDLQACIDEREQHISRVSSQIDNYKRLQKLMIENKARQVSEVPEQTEWADHK